jgi:hypothetical protein
MAQPIPCACSTSVSFLHFWHLWFFIFYFKKKRVMQKQQLQEDEAVKKILHLLFGEVYGLR